MRLFLFCLCNLFYWATVNATVPDNDGIATAKVIADVNGYCSADADFSNIDATASGYKKGIFWNSEGKDVWFKFTAVRTDLNVTVTGKTASSTNTLIAPLVAIYTYENNVLTEIIGSMSSNNNITSAYKGGLTIGTVYYIRVSAENDAMGTFKMCINNYTPAKKPGQDCSSASVLCNKDTFTELNVSGAGTNNHEATGTCLLAESNSAWYTWSAATSGTLTFTITPIQITDDIDWVLYDLGPNGDCNQVTASNAIRCASGSGVNCTPRYYITGLDLTSTDLNEQINCVVGQDGMLKFVDMVAGHNYALLIDNVSKGNNGFTIAFGGTGEFAGPKAEVFAQVNSPCSPTQSFTLSTNASNYTALKWDFGEGASLGTANTAGPFTLTYNTPGYKTVVLETTGPRGCSIVSNTTFYVGPKPVTPIITANKPNFCINDEIKLEISEIPEATYLWTGPNNFTATTASVNIPVTNLNQAGNYSVTVTIGTCTSDLASINIPPIIKNPVASFTTDPQLPGKFAAPVPFKFINRSKDASTYAWDFGDGESSTEAEPTHIYTKAGRYTVTLNAFTVNNCVNSTSINNLVVLEAGSLLVPNSFSPNGDGVNDEFNVNIANLKKFSINIFNRFGVKVFSTNNIFNSWNGTWKNQPLPVGAYYYQIKAIDLNNKEVTYNGSITLIR